MDEVIGSLDEISPARLTRIVRARTGRSDVSVTSVRLKLQKALPYSTVARIGLEFSSAKVPFSSDLFLKIIRPQLPNANSAMPSAEAEFYESLAPTMPSPPVVHCWDSASSKEDGRAHLLLADHSETHSQPEQNVPPSKDDSIRAVEALARCHARFWEDPRLGIDLGKLYSESDLSLFVSELETNVERFLAAAGDLVTTEERTAYRHMLARASAIWGRLTERSALTITHGDCHWWNFLFPNDVAADGKTYIIDWHLWHVDVGARDLAFLLALGGFAEPRPEMEAELLRHYHRSLIENGVSNYSWDGLWEDYRRSAIRNLNIPVIFWSQGKHESTWQTALKRAFDGYERLRCIEL